MTLWKETAGEEEYFPLFFAGGNDLETAVRMAGKVKAAGMKYLPDFHYSDFWADPGKQIKPKAWRDYGEEELEAARIDGLNEVQIFFRMFFPTMRSTYAAAVVA